MSDLILTDFLPLLWTLFLRTLRVNEHLKCFCSLVRFAYIPDYHHYASKTPQKLPDFSISVPTPSYPRQSVRSRIKQQQHTVPRLASTPSLPRRPRYLQRKFQGDSKPNWACSYN